MSLIRIACALLTLTCLTGSIAADPPPATAEKASLYDEAADASKQIRSALKAARGDNQRVLIQWGANWCGWCHRLQAAFTEHPEIRRTLQYEYTVVHVDVGRFDKHMDIAEQYGADLRKSGLPFLTVLAADGTVVTNQETGSLESAVDGEAGHDASKVNTFLTTHQAPRQNADEVLASALATAERFKRRVFLHFGAPSCSWCHRFEAWMNTEEVARELRRDFIMCKIDIQRMTHGEEVMLRYTDGERVGIPYFVFLESNGDVIIDSMVPKGNLGCPWERDEITQFKMILSQACLNLAPQELTEMLRVLHTMRDDERRLERERQRAAEAASKDEDG